MSLPVLGQTAATVYLCDFGIALYRQGRFDEALSEFKKALIVEPNNQIAQEYMNLIFQEELQIPLSKEAEPAQVPQKPAKETTRDEVIDRALYDFSNQGFEETGRQFKDERPKIKAGPVEISGQVELRAGFTPQSAYWKRANFNLNERDWRMLSSAALDRKENTYDPRIYDRLRLDLDTDNEEGFNFHSNIMVDPWSFTGRSELVDLSGSAGDLAQFQLKYWSNTGYTIEQAVDTLENGDLVNLPEIKVVNAHTEFPVSITTTGGNTYTLDEIKIYRKFQPFRELWVDYVQEDLKLRVFPIAYENQALTFDDPLRLSNNHIWWEDSPWLHAWKPGVYNSGVSPVDFTKGYWDNALSFLVRDTEGRRLTALRGGTFEFRPWENTSLVTSIATPMSIWQDYNDVDNVLSATRLKQSVTDKIDLGLSLTARVGFNTGDASEFDAWNYAGGADFSYEIIDGIKSNLEIAYSQSRYDISNSEYRTRSRGFAYYASLIGRYPFEESIMRSEFGYEGLKPAEYDNFFTKFKIYAARLDKDFDASLSNYANTRKDEWWSRHIHFRKPFDYYYQGEGQMLSWEDIKNY
ncbi:MAG: tetratricopeptide repeat protein, partial [Candidatus Omnitrophota bacterium]|nr:tetratricopeptide repeat protein [Candidatus Omnitrophota bacterium]